MVEIHDATTWAPLKRKDQRIGTRKVCSGSPCTYFGQLPSMVSRPDCLKMKIWFLFESVTQLSMTYDEVTFGDAAPSYSARSSGQSWINYKRVPLLLQFEGLNKNSFSLQTTSTFLYHTNRRNIYQKESCLETHLSDRPAYMRLAIRETPRPPRPTSPTPSMRASPGHTTLWTPVCRAAYYALRYV